MMKKLLFALFAVLSAGSMSAANVGDYLYTVNAKFKVTGENMVTNGSFNVGDGLQGWQNDLGSAVSATWGVVTSAGPSQENAIESKGASTEEGSMLVNSWQLSSGIYAISYYVYSPVDVNSSVTAGNANYVNLFANTTGDNVADRTIGGVKSWKAEQWTQVVDTIFVNADQEFLVFNANNVAEGVRFTNFELHPVSEVYDTRIIDRIIAYAEKLLAEPDLSSGRDEFAGVVEMMKGMISDPSQSEDVASMESLIEQFNLEFDKFMNENGGNTNSGDWSTVAGKNWNNLKDANFVGSYWTVGDRWGFFPNAPFARNSAGDMADLERKEGEGYILTAGIQRSFDLGVLGVRIENANLSAGKYFFSIEAQAVAAANTSSPYGDNHNLPFIGPTMTVGSTTVTFEEDTLSGYYWKRYYVIGEVAEGETVKAEFLFPGYSDKRGGKISLRNPEFRMIGKSELQLSYELAVKNYVVQQTELKKRIDNYPNDVAAFHWGHDEFNNALAAAQEVYNNSLSVVDENGTCSLPVDESSVTQLKDGEAELLAQVRAMNSAKNAITATNKPYTDLVEAIAEAKAVLADPKNANGNAAAREALEAAIAAGQALVDAVSETDEGEAFTAAIAEIKNCQITFQYSTASRNNPAEYAIQNPFFGTGNATGWNATGQTDNGRWKYQSGMKGFENQTCIRFDRGYTAASKNRVSQTVVVDQPGMYEFEAQAYAYNCNLNFNNQMMNEETGEPYENCYLFFGTLDNPMKTTVYTVTVWNADAQAEETVSVASTASNLESAYASLNESGTNYQYSCPWPNKYLLTFEKAAAGEETLEFGFDTMQNGTFVSSGSNQVGANNAGFGGVHVRYCGPADAYKDGIRNLPVELLNSNSVVYNLNGMRMVKPTQKGLYIQNGKKFVVK